MCSKSILCYYTNKIFLLLVLVSVIVLSSIAVNSLILKKHQEIEKSQTVATKETKNEDESQKDTNVESNQVSVLQNESNETITYYIFCIVLIIAITTTVIILSILIYKDNSYILYAKQEMLDSVKDFLPDLKYDEKDKENVTTEKNKSSVSKEKSIKEELVKQYINCIQEL